MAGAADIARSAKELRGSEQNVLDAVSGLGSGSSGLLSSISAFFHNADNLLALAICLVSVVGIYRLLRSEHIIPTPSRPMMGSGLGALLESPMARRLLLRALFAVVLAAIGLAAASGHLAGLVDRFKALF